MSRRFASDGPWHAFLYAHGVMKDLGTLGGACGVNAAGQVTGESTTTDDDTHALLYAGGVLRDLNPFVALSVAANQGWLLERGSAISDSGWIASYDSHNDGQRHAFLAKPHTAVTSQLAAMASR